MKISYKWLKQYIAIPDDVTAEEIAAKLTVSTVEIEGVENLADSFKDIVVGEILEVVKHPDADRLTVCRVNIGSSDPVQIVCGAENVKVGLKTVVALPGAKVRWHGKGEPVILEKAKVRGVESYGMMCAPDEVGLSGEGYSNDGIVELAEGLPGENIAKVLEFDDSVIEIDNKSITNRPDLWGHYGVAREISALFGWKLFTLPAGELPLVGDKQHKINVTVAEPDLCYRYSLAGVTGVYHVQSPRWLRRLLSASGLRPISALVDITNFVMLELGQPMHVFDYNNIAGHEIIVKNKYTTDFVTLDNVSRKLDEQVLMIADKEKPLAIAGIMGGEASQITEATTTVVLESATFDPVSIRRSSVRLGLRTDASARYEKSLDPEMTDMALKRALSLIKTIFPDAKLCCPLVDKYPKKSKPITIEVDTNFIRQRIGKVITNQEMVSILEKLSFKVVQKKDNLKITVPSFRATKDVSIAEDIIDEIARIYGFANIEEAEPLVAMSFESSASYEFELIQKIKTILARTCGMTEVYLYSFVSRRAMELANIPIEKRLAVQNYVNDDSRYLRTSLAENLLVSAESNLRFYDNFSLFEIGRVYNHGEGEWAVDEKASNHLPKQPFHIAGLNLSAKSDDQFYLAKGQLVALFEQLGTDIQWEVDGQEALSFLNPDRYLRIKAENQLVGWLAEVNAETINEIAPNKTIVIWEIDLNILKKYVGNRKIYKALSKFPEIVLDVAVVVGEKVLWENIKNAISDCHPLITKLELFDVYRLEKSGSDGRSLAFHVTLQSPERTLRQEEAKDVRNIIEKILVEQFNAEIR